MWHFILVYHIVDRCVQNSDDLLGYLHEQVAHFYNTIDQQMIPSQQAMMLESALAFERLVKNPKSGGSLQQIKNTCGRGTKNN